MWAPAERDHRGRGRACNLSGHPQGRRRGGMGELVLQVRADEQGSRRPSSKWKQQAKHALDMREAKKRESGTRLERKCGTKLAESSAKCAAETGSVGLRWLLDGRKEQKVEWIFSAEPFRDAFWCSACAAVRGAVCELHFLRLLT